MMEVLLIVKETIMKFNILFKNKSIQIEKALRKALLENGEMDFQLYKYELEEDVLAIKQGIIDDGEDFAIVITENKGNVAMFLMTKGGELHINEKAREKLNSMWIKTYEFNINYFLPSMLAVLKTGHYWINGVKLV